MTLKVFLALPEEDEKIINIESNWGAFFNLLNEAVKLLKNKNIKVSYDSENFQAFKDKLVQLDNTYMHKAGTALRIVLSIGAEDLNDNPTKKTDHHYFEYTFEPPAISRAEKPLAEMAERQLKYELEKYLILNCWDRYTSHRSKIMVFKDALHNDLLPHEFIALENIVSFEKLNTRLESFQNDFSLNDNVVFERTSFFYQGKSMYREKSTNRYWYLDNFHKNEYEIFDGNGRHLGTADLNGNVNSLTAVPGRIIAVN